jgi:hypothetical protein
MRDSAFLDSYAESSSGLLLVANGLGPVLRWDGLAAQAEPAGTAAPAAAPTLAGADSGPIVGTYYGYLRYVDRYGQYSNLSPVSAAFAASGATGTVEDAADGTPIVVTSSGHGLTSGARVKISGVGGNTAANNTWRVTVLDPDTFSLDNSTGSGTYDGGGTWLAGAATITYAGLEIPADPKVARRQLLRNTDGQTDTFYVDLDTTDLTSVALSSARDDTELAAQEAQPILDADGQELANRFTPPPAHKAVLAQSGDRMFLGVEHAYALGNVRVTFGSATVYGVGTDWPETFAGRVLYVTGASRPYAIAAADGAAQTLTLTEPYLDASDPFAVYAVRPQPAEARLVYYSEAGLPEAWPATSALSVQQDGDEITGLMPQGAWLYILERRHVYRLTFHADPGTDGAVFLAGLRGCVNNRCWVIVGDTAYLLDEQGVHAFDGEQSDPVSSPIRLLFQPGGGGVLEVNWKAAEFFHAVHHAPQETIRWYVSLAGERLPRHALCYAYQLKRWWVEEFAAPIGASCAGDMAGVPQVFLGSGARRVLAYGAGPLDGPDPSAGTTRGMVTASTPTSFTDSRAVFASSGLAGVPVGIVAGRGKGQTRRVTAVSGQMVSVDQPWLTLPDPTSVYQLGGAAWNYRSGWWRWAQSEEDTERRAEVLFRAVPGPASLDVRIHEDFQDTPKPWGSDMSGDAGGGVASAAGDPDLVADLTKASGFVQKRMGSHRELYTDGPRFVQLGLRGFSGQDPVTVYGLGLDGAAGGRG